MVINLGECTLYSYKANDYYDHSLSRCLSSGWKGGQLSEGRGDKRHLFKDMMFKTIMELFIVTGLVHLVTIATFSNSYGKLTFHWDGIFDLSQ